MTGLGETEDNAVAIRVSDGEDGRVVCQASDEDDLNFCLDEELYRVFYTSSGEPRTYEKKPLLVTEAATALCKDYHGVVAATVFGIKLAGMKEMGFFSIPDGDCGEETDHTMWAKPGVDVWLAGDGEAGLEGGVSTIRNEDDLDKGTKNLLAGTNKPIKTEESMDGFDYGWDWSMQADEDSPLRFETSPSEDEDEWLY